MINFTFAYLVSGCMTYVMARLVAVSVNWSFGDLFCFICLLRYVEPLPLGSPVKFEFENLIVGQDIPSGFIPAIEKGFKEAANS